MKLVRKVNPAKWTSTDWASLERIPSDALTICMKTTGNTLSFWRVEDKIDGEEEAILALLGAHEKIDKIDVVFIEDSELPYAKIEKTAGNTIFSDLRGLHVDVADIDHSSLLETANVLGAKIFQDNIKRLTRADFKKRIQNALDSKRVSWDSIPEKMRSELKNPDA